MTAVFYPTTPHEDPLFNVLNSTEQSSKRLYEGRSYSLAGHVSVKNSLVSRVASLFKLIGFVLAATLSLGGLLAFSSFRNRFFCELNILTNKPSPVYVLDKAKESNVGDQKTAPAVSNNHKITLNVQNPVDPDLVREASRVDPCPAPTPPAASKADLTKESIGQLIEKKEFHKALAAIDRIPPENRISLLDTLLCVLLEQKQYYYLKETLNLHPQKEAKLEELVLKRLESGNFDEIQRIYDFSTDENLFKKFLRKGVDNAVSSFKPDVAYNIAAHFKEERCLFKMIKVLLGVKEYTRAEFLLCNLSYPIEDRALCAEVAHLAFENNCYHIAATCNRSNPDIADAKDLCVKIACALSRSGEGNEALLTLKQFVIGSTISSEDKKLWQRAVKSNDYNTLLVAFKKIKFTS